MPTDRGIVGDRQLVAVQTFDISRLTTHAVVIVPGTFVAVSGVGPDGDSNGPGKTSFLGAVSILLADPQWNLEGNGGKSASGILFRPDAAGLDPSQRITAAPHGYITGLFAEPGSPRESAITVWIKISSTSPYVQARWVPGLHVADADSDEERELQADSLWQALPQTSTIAARRMAQELYGDAPRCLSYLDTDLRPSIPSLLSQQMTKMKPEEIGAALIALSGQTSQLEEENRQRNTVLEQQARLREAESEATQSKAEEDTELAGIDARDSARRLLQEARSKWALYVAQQYLTVLEKDRRAASEVSERKVILDDAKKKTTDAATNLDQLRAVGDLAEQERHARHKYNLADQSLQDLNRQRTIIETRKSSLIGERNELISQSYRWNGRTPEQAAAELEDAVIARGHAASGLESADKAVKAAEVALKDAQAGRSGIAGQLAERLRAEAGIPEAAALADVIDLDDDARIEWEPRLYTLRDAVIVPRERASDALRAIADEPGAQVVVADSLDLEAPRLTTGGIRYPAGLHTLLNALTQRFAFRRDPNRADDDALGTSTLGNFPEPLVGRDALVQRAEQHLEATKAGRATAAGTLRNAEARRILAVAQEKAARAVERLKAIGNELTAFDGNIAALDVKIGAGKQLEATANEAYEGARTLRNSHDTRVELAKLQLKAAQDRESEASRKLDQVLADREKLAVEAWSIEFGGTEDDAARLHAASPDSPATRPRTLLRHSAEHLRDAMAAFQQSSDNTPEDLKNAEEARERFAEQQPDKPLPFKHVAGPLRVRLDGFAEHDRRTRARINADRVRREEALDQWRLEETNASNRLATVQDMIESTIEGTLRVVSKALDKMTKFGSYLDVNSVRPVGAAPWRWEVTPRWRRSPSGGLVSYKEAANSAQVKMFAIRLVLAALIADSETTGRVLILDELGNSLGDVNRRDVLSSLSAVAEREQVTIFGTCQDSVLSDAADFFGELIWFTHAAATEAYNQPTRVWGHDAVGERVDLTAGWLQAGRAYA
jgi:hypothetical protein